MMANFNFLTLFLIFASLSASSATYYTHGGKKVPWWQIKVTRSQGPNACIVEEIPELGKKYYTECKFWPIRKVCGRDPVIRYECCEGFKMIPGHEGCIGVKPLKNVLETARDLGATKFVQYLEESGLSQELAQEGTFTLFVPTNQAFEDAQGRAAALKIESFRSSGRSNPLLRYHFSDRKYFTKDFTSANNELQSQYQGRKLRVSRYSTGMDTVNCALISRKDQEATNGVVHLIDSVLDPTKQLPLDVARVVMEDGRFRKLTEILHRCNLIQRLSEPGKTYTFLAPSDEAFNKIQPSTYDKILRDSASCTALFENHVIPHVMCMPVITEDYKAKSIGRGRLEFGCDQKGYRVEGRKVAEQDAILGENGVVYVLDEVLIPDRAKTVLELAEAKNLTTFVQLLRVAGMEETLSNAGEYTLFVPTEEAWSVLEETILEEAKRNEDLARKIVLFHMAHGRTRTNEIKNNQALDSLDNENQIRLQVYRKSYGVEDAIIETGDIEGFNGVIHVISKAIFPATQSAGDLLRKSSNYSIFLEAMETLMQVEPAAIDITRPDRSSAHYTFFVPTDEAFRRIGSSQLQRLRTDSAYMSKVIRNHVSSQMFSTDAFRPNLIYEMQTRQNALAMTCDQQRAFKINDAHVLEKDIVTTNGIVHTIDALLLPDSPAPSDSPPEPLTETRESSEEEPQERAESAADIRHEEEREEHEERRRQQEEHERYEHERREHERSELERREYERREYERREHERRASERSSSHHTHARHSAEASETAGSSESGGDTSDAADANPAHGRGDTPAHVEDNSSKDVEDLEDTVYGDYDGDGQYELRRRGETYHRRSQQRARASSGRSAAMTAHHSARMTSSSGSSQQQQASIRAQQQEQQASSAGAATGFGYQETSGFSAGGNAQYRRIQHGQARRYEATRYAESGRGVFGYSEHTF